MEIYQLKPILDDPRFGEFDFEDLPSLLDNDYLYQDFDGRNRAKLSWEPVPLAGLWSPQYASGSNPSTGPVR